MPFIRIPSPLRPYAGGNKEVFVNGSTVTAALADLTLRHPALKPHLFKENGELRPFVNVFKGRENIVDLQDLQTALAEQDSLLILPSVAGG
jgi:adenylyltransferase/sulfurtransferase